MPKIAKSAFAAAGFAAAVLFSASAVNSQDMMAPFGGEEDVAYAGTLWNAITEARLIGANAIQTRPYEGTEPHGFVLETLYDKIAVGGHTGTVIVKRNYGPEGVTVDEVANDPGKHLAAVTVMFQREDGYDADNKNWYWAKYLADGSLDKNPAGKQLAGRVAKGADAGCIACHSGADGGDYEFLRDTGM